MTIDKPYIRFSTPSSRTRSRIEELFLGAKPMTLPAPELGWKILRELADSISDRNEAANFEADARPLEGGFTSGHITEAQYRYMLRTMRLLYMPPHQYGICRLCLCTDERACEGGCYWVDAAHTLCSRCVVEAPKS
jgi:hypothetical protein